MFETNMDEYLDEEVESVKIAFDVICKGWDQEVSLSTQLSALIFIFLLSIRPRMQTPSQQMGLGNSSLPRTQPCLSATFSRHLLTFFCSPLQSFHEPSVPSVVH